MIFFPFYPRLFSSFESQNVIDMRLWKSSQAPSAGPEKDDVRLAADEIDELYAG